MTRAASAQTGKADAGGFDRAQEFGSGRHAVRNPGDILHGLHFRDSDAMGESCDRCQIGLGNGASNRIDPHPCAMPGQHLSGRSSGSVLVLCGHGVLEIDDDLVGAEGERLCEHAALMSGHKQIAAGGHTTPASTRSASSAWSMPSSVL